MGSDCKITERKRELAEGAESMARIMLAPELWPARVTLEALPPNDGATRLMNSKALETSLTARFVFPLGAKNPS